MAQFYYVFSQKINSFKFFYIAICLLSIFQISCIKNTIKIYDPIYGDISSKVSYHESRELLKPGKIYVKDNFIFINEQDAGIHIIDNKDPKNPENIGFINVPGNVDIAIKENILYLDSYSDLVIIDIGDKFDIVEINRLHNIFPQSLRLIEWCPDVCNPIDPSKGTVIGWKLIKEETSWEWKTGHVDEELTTISTSSTGTGGSMARFTIVAEYLYAVDSHSLHVIDISNPEAPIGKNSQHVSIGIETIFPFAEKLFIGSQMGMFIYDLTDPGNPAYLSKFTHARSCDPVVAEGNMAYVTLRDGASCRRGENQLDIIDISNIHEPVHIKSYPMGNPHGLAIQDGILFICDGLSGLKVYNARDPDNLELINIISDLSTYDIILNEKMAIVTGTDGLYQYDFTDLSDINLLSKIPVPQISEVQ